MSNAPADYATRRWNPTTGCRPDLACHARCWARRFAFRHAGRFGYPKNDPFRPTVHADRLDEPLHWRKPQVVAVSFMGDLFCDGIPDEAILAVFAMAMHAPRHTYLFLTKRPARMAEILRKMGGPAPCNFWFGLSIMDQFDADREVPKLLRLNRTADNLWLSVEPQVSPIHLGNGDLARIRWVVQGCESGPLRRPFDLVWARSMRDQCVAAKAPYYLKQAVSARGLGPGRGVGLFVDKRPVLDGRMWRETPW